jgi:Protein of unknown function (DUF1566)
MKIRMIYGIMIVLLLTFAILLGVGGESAESGEKEMDFVVVDTGQDICFDYYRKISCPEPNTPLYGQDGQYDGNKFSYLDNGDGTVTDLNTGLIWQKVPDAEKRSWHKAFSYAKSLELAEHDDWRLPTAKELYSLIDYSRKWPRIDTTYFVCNLDPRKTKSTQYWSSTGYIGLTHHGRKTAFGVNFATGHIKGYPVSMENYIRCVRGKKYGENNFVDNGDGTVTDLATGLMWQQSDDGIAKNWKDSLAYAEDLTLAGYSDWRLPNARELQSILDYTRRNPAIDPIFSTSNGLGWFWTSTTLFGDRRPPHSSNYGFAWYVAFGMAVDTNGGDQHGAGAVRYDPKSVEIRAGGPPKSMRGGRPTDETRTFNYVRCVRMGVK